MNKEKIKIYDFRVYIDINTGEYETDVMNTDISRNRKINEKTKELFNLICNKSDKELE